MLCKKIIRLCAVLVLSGVSSIAVSQSLSFMDALQFVDDEGTAEIPENYTSIGYGAFQNSGVKKVVLPSTINSIQGSAFANAINLHEINLPSGISSIGPGAFYGASSLENITIPETVTRIEPGTFENSGITQISLPSITYIGESAFENSGLESVNLAENVYIQNRAFYKTKIKDLKIPNGATIRTQTFAFISELVSLEIGVYVNISSGSSTFQSSGNKLKTIVTSSPIGCSNDGYTGLCPGYASDLSNLEFLVFKGNQNIDYHKEISSSGAKIVLQYASDANISQQLDSSEVIVVSPTFISGPINSSPHSYCSGVDADEDGFPDCYDEFPNDPDRWFDYENEDESNDVPQSASNDTDGDGILNIYDVSNYNHSCSSDISFGADSIDTDQDGVSNYYDCDDDNDGLLDVYETGFPFNYDISVDGLLSGLQLGTNPLNPDSDFDGTLDGLDAFPLDNTESLDTDSDGIGNNADTDDDGDGHFDLLDAFPLDANEWMDSDLDGVGNNADTDDDNDGVIDEEDAFPYTASESVDTDGDGVGDNSDAFPNDSSETLDTDLDGIGNNADDDDDNDGVADADDSDPLNDSIGALESQNLFVMGNPVAVNGYLATISVGYDVSDDNNQLTGIGFRVHYDSSIYSYSAVENTLNDSVVVDGMGPYQDVEDFDNDSTTDSYIVFGWASVSGEWPNVELPAKLSDIKMFVNWADYEAGSTTSNINLSIVDNNEGYGSEVTSYSMNVLPATWDFDGNGSGDALTDGLMLLRYTFGVRDINMTNGAIAENAVLSATQIVNNMHREVKIADIDGNGSTDALTDGLMLLRYMFGLRGSPLISGAISSDATRTTALEIEQYIELYMPDGLSSPEQSEQNFLVGDWRLKAIPEVLNKSIDNSGDWNQIFSDNEWYCLSDDTFSFLSIGEFQYKQNEETWNHYRGSAFNESGCQPPAAPWNGSGSYTYQLDDQVGKLTVSGIGAYLGLSYIANGIHRIEEAYFAPDSVTYDYTKVSEDEVLLQIDAYTALYRFSLERMISN